MRATFLFFLISAISADFCCFLFFGCRRQVQMRQQQQQLQIASCTDFFSRKEIFSSHSKIMKWKSRHLDSRKTGKAQMQKMQNTLALIYDLMTQ